VNTAAIASPQPGGAAAPRWNAAQTVALAIALAGATLMAAIASGAIYPIPHPFIGAHLYDIYAQALFVEGHWNLPMRDLKLEGHFTPDGNGYLYYGLTPLLTRLLFLPFVDLPTPWISSFSMWFWAVLGNAAYHRAFWLALSHGAGGANRINGWASALLACAIWFAAPGLVMSATGAVFDEPVIAAYALTAGVVLLIAMVSFGRIDLSRAIVPMAVLAGLTVHARPHLAVGLYIAVSLMAAWLVLRERKRWKSAFVAMALLGTFGSALLASNYVRFGNPMTMHGGFAHEKVQYASIFWGTESREAPRAVAFTKYGQFNASRILPNAMVYVATPPSNMGYDNAVASLEAFHQSLLRKGDAITYAQPRVGTLFLWPGWMLLMIVGLSQRDSWRMPAAAGMAGVIVSSLFMLGYMTITLRYHVDLWSVIALPALFGLAAVARRSVADPREARNWRSVLLVLATVGLFVTLNKTAHTRSVFLDAEGLLSREFCMKLAAGKQFSPARQAEICDPVSNLKGST
jgi:hypothetical protein